MLGETQPGAGEFFQLLSDDLVLRLARDVFAGRSFAAKFVCGFGHQ